MSSELTVFNNSYLSYLYIYLDNTLFQIEFCSYLRIRVIIRIDQFIYDAKQLIID